MHFQPASMLRSLLLIIAMLTGCTSATPAGTMGLLVEVGPEAVSLVAIGDRGHTDSAPNKPGALEYRFVSNTGDTLSTGYALDPRAATVDIAKASGDVVSRSATLTHGVVRIEVPRETGTLVVIENGAELGRFGVRVEDDAVSENTVVSEPETSEASTIFPVEVRRGVRKVMIVADGFGGAQGLEQFRALSAQVVDQLSSRDPGAEYAISRLDLSTENHGAPDARSGDVPEGIFGISSFGGDGRSDMKGNLYFSSPRTGARLAGWLRAMYGSETIVVLSPTSVNARVLAPGLVIAGADNVDDVSGIVDSILNGTTKLAAAMVPVSAGLDRSDSSATNGCTASDYADGLCAPCEEGSTCGHFALTEEFDGDALDAADREGEETVKVSKTDGACVATSEGCQKPANSSVGAAAATFTQSLPTLSDSQINAMIKECPSSIANSLGQIIWKDPKTGKIEKNNAKLCLMAPHPYANDDAAWASARLEGQRETNRRSAVVNGRPCATQDGSVRTETSFDDSKRRISNKTSAFGFAGYGDATILNGQMILRATWPMLAGAFGVKDKIRAGFVEGIQKARVFASRTEAPPATVFTCDMPPDSASPSR